MKILVLIFLSYLKMALGVGTSVPLPDTLVRCVKAVSGETNLEPSRPATESSSDIKYKELLSNPNQMQVSPQVTQMLNEAFWPLLTRLSEVTDQEISGAISVGSIFKGEYSKNGKGVPTARIQPAGRWFDRLQKIIDKNSTNHFSNGEEIGFSGHFIFSRPDFSKEPITQLANLAITPIGDYGQEFSLKLHLTTRAILRLAYEYLDSLGEKAWEENSALLSRETARGKDAALGYSKNAPLRTMEEGIQSFHDFLNVTLSRKVDWAQEGRDALKKLLMDGENPSGLAADFTRRLPLGLIGPYGLMGVHISNGLELSTNGKLTWTQKIKAFFENFKKKEAAQNGNPNKRGVCPFAKFFRGSENDKKPTTGLHVFSQLYWKIFEKIDREIDTSKIEIEDLVK